MSKEEIREYNKKYRLKNKEEIREYNKKYRLKNKEEIRRYNKQYRLKNKEKIIRQEKKYRLQNKDKIAKQRKKYRLKSKERAKEYDKKYRSKNKGKLKQYRLKNKEKIKERDKKYQLQNRKRINKYFADRRKTDINFKLADNLRSRLYLAIKNNYKSGSAVKDLGCPIEYFKKWLENQFVEGMLWNNYGKWEIDHQIPLSIIDLTVRDNFLHACHYTNLQPMWKEENLRKRNYISRNVV